MLRIDMELTGDRVIPDGFNPGIASYLLHVSSSDFPILLSVLSQARRDGFILEEGGIPGDQRQLGHSINRGLLGSLFETRSKGRDVAAGTGGAWCAGLSEFNPPFDRMASQNCHSSHRCTSLRGKRKLGRCGEIIAPEWGFSSHLIYCFFLLFVLFFFYYEIENREPKSPH